MTVGGPLVAFVGPSLPPAEVRRLAPEVVVLPPVCQGDLASAVLRHRPTAILVVDGEFGQSLSVWHKEILWALDRGVRVVGSSSMGALRAAELERFGMEGVGVVFAHYRDGWLTSDADVALVHADADEDYRALTWPLVNVRATIAVLREEGAVDEAEAHALAAAAEAVHFRQRGEVALGRRLCEDGLPDDDAGRLARLVTDAYVDQKRLDAEEALAVLLRIDEIPPPVAEKPLDLGGRGLEPLLWSDVVVHRPTGSLRRYQLVADAALHDPDYASLMDRALDGYLVDALALEYDVQATPGEVAAQRRSMLGRLGIAEDSLDAWLADNDLDRSELDALVVREAKRTRMRRWMLTTRIIERNRRMIVEQLQVEGRYAKVADAAGRRRKMADSRPTPPYPDTVERIKELVARQRAVSGWSPTGDITDVADDLGFDTVMGMLVALSDSAEANIELQERRSRMAGLLGLADVSPQPPGPGAQAHALLEAHQATHVLLAAVELALPAALAAGPATTAELAVTTGTDPDRLERLLRALRATRTVSGGQPAWELTEVGQALVPDAEGPDESLSAHAEQLRLAAFPAWAGLAGVVRGEQPPAYPSDDLADRAIAASTNALGHAEVLIDHLDLEPGSVVADIGGGLGLAAEALAAKRPDLDVLLAELPGTAERARARLGPAAGVEVVTLTGAGAPDALPRPVDRCLLTRVVCTLDDDAAVDVLRLARNSLRAGGRVEIVDLVDDGTPAAVFGDLLHLARSGGAVRALPAWREMARRAGLEVVSRRRLTPPYEHLSLAVADQEDEAR